MVLLKLAYRNLKGAGTRAWLNVIVLSMAFVMMIYLQGLYDGIGNQNVNISVDTHYGGGQLWSPKYDPYDRLTAQDAPEVIPDNLQSLVDAGNATPMLIYPASMYPKGLLQPVRMRGMHRSQEIVNLPTNLLEVKDEGMLPVVIGARFANSLSIEAGEVFTVQWRDANGTYDAVEAQVVHIMETANNLLDRGYLWIDLTLLQEMTGLENSATYLILEQGFPPEQVPISEWKYMSVYDLSADVRAFVAAKSGGSVFMYVFLLALALLAIFDTQVLNLWRRRKEMGTMMALGLTRGRIIRLFTLEGALNGVLAAILALVWGGPLLFWQASVGFKIPYDEDMIGFLMPEVIMPAYTFGLIAMTTLVTLVTVTFVSWLPVRKVAQLRPTDALRGKQS